MDIDGKDVPRPGGPTRRSVLLAAGAGPLAAALATGCPRGRAAPAPAGRPLYVGAYGTGAGRGLLLASYDPGSGAVTGAGTVPGVANPSFLALAGDRLYAVNEQASGEVTAVSLRGDRPEVLNTRSVEGAGPCHLSVHPDGRYLLSACFGSGSVAVHPIAPDGRLGPLTDLVTYAAPDRSDRSRPHQVLTDPQGRFVLTVDLGTDSIHTSLLDTGTGRLTAVSQARVQPGAGPRHLAFHPSGRFAYVVTELSSSVIVCAYDPPTGRLTPGPTRPTVPADDPPLAEPNHPAEVLVSPDGAHVYVSNRGHDSIARFAVSGSGGSLTLLDTVATGGAGPRHISLDPTGSLLYAANQHSDTVTVFHRDAATGALTPTGARFATPGPVFVLPA